MLLPSVNAFNDFFGENLLEDDWMRFPFGNDWFGGNKSAAQMMKTDVRELDGGYEVMIDLPGFSKDEINVKLENGYLTISAARGNKQEEKSEGKFIRRERYFGSVSRSFYVGDAVTQEEIKAKYENGILRLAVPKKEAAVEEKNPYIAIEG